MTDQPHEPTRPHPQQPPPEPPPWAGQPPQPWAPYAVARPEHPQATTVLVLGILGLILCQVLSPFAWVMGNRVVREIDAAQGQVGGRSSASAGRICGIIGTVLLGLALLAVVLVVVLGLLGFGLALTGLSQATAP